MNASKKVLLSIIGLFVFANIGFAQTYTVTTSPPLTPNNGQSGICFNAGSKDDVKILEIHNTCNTGSQTYTIWYNTDSINGAPTINTANGWVAYQTGTVTGNNTTPVGITLTTPLLIPAGKTYGFCIEVGTRYMTAASGPFVFTDGVVHINTGTNVGYGGPPPNPTFHIRQFLGKIVYELAAAKVGFDIEMSSIDSPTVFGIGNNNLVVTIKNNLADSVVFLDFGYQVDKKAPVLVSNHFIQLNGKNDTLWGTKSYQYKFPTPINLTALGTYDLKVWVANANDSVPDNDPTNDTIFTTFCTGMSGQYTIGATGSYATFSDAVNALTSCGVAGPITFKVEPGTYNERVVIPSGITGMDAMNTVTFDGLNKSKVTLTYSGTSSTNRATLLFNGADYFVFKNMKIQNTGTSYSVAVMLMNQADHNSILDCDLVVGTNSSSYAQVLVATSSESSTGGTGNNANYTLVQNCTLTNGYYGAVFYGTGSTTPCMENKIITCDFTGQYYYGIYSYYQRAAEFINNTIDIGYSTTSAYGIYHYYGSKTLIDGNNIMPGQYGIYTYYENNYFQNDSSLFINNLIHNFKNTTYQIGIRGYYYNYNLKILTNTIHVDGSYANNYSYAAIQLYYPYYPTVKNNILISDGGIMLFSVYYYPYGNMDIDYNDYIYPVNANSTNMFFNYNVYYKDLAAWKAASQGINMPHDENSWENEDPKFDPNNAYHLNPNYPPLTGETFSYIDSDVDGDPRCIYRTAIGADESGYTTGMPTSYFIADDTICFNSPITFLNTAGKDEKQGYWWYLNGVLKTTEHDFTHTFGTGTYYDTISLVTRNCTGADTFTKVVLIDAPSKPPIADFIAEANEIETGFPIQLFDISTNCPSAWNWSVRPATVTIGGLGTVPSYSFLAPTGFYSQDPIVLIEYPGVYKVCLSVYNTVGGDSICKEKYIVVQPSQWICSYVLPSVSAAMRGILFDDQGPVSDYGNGRNCDILLSPCASSIDFSFTEFNVAAGDYFRIYQGIDNNGTPLWNLNKYGNNGINGDIGDVGFQKKFSSNTGSLFIEWETNSSGTAPGFVGSWEATPGQFPAPNALFVCPDTVCLMAPVYFENMSTSNEGTNSWDYDMSGFYDSFEEDGEYKFPFPGWNQVKLVVEDCGGTSVYVKDIYVIQPSIAPTPDFEADILRPVAGMDAVTFTDLTQGCVDAWTWSITPNTYSVISDFPNGQAPQIQFNDTGYYSITLKSAFGAVSKSITKTDYIYAIRYCKPGVKTLGQDVGISYVKLAEFNGNPLIENTTAIGKDAFTDYSATKSAYVARGASFYITVDRNTTYNTIDRKVWIDWNINGEYESSELLGHESNASTKSWTTVFTVPTTALKGATRMRVATSNGGSANEPCNTRLFGEIEEYRIIIRDDATPPVISIIGLDTVMVEQCMTYVDSGATAWDNLDGIVTSGITTTNNLDLMNHGEYWYKYEVTDSKGNKATKYRVIYVTPEMDAPVFSLKGNASEYVEVHNSFVDPGYTVSDACSGMDTVEIVSNVNIAKFGSYKIDYTAIDNNGNTSNLSRTVIVGDTTDPTVALIGATPLMIEVKNSFVDPGVMVSDNYCTLDQIMVDVTGTVLTDVLGTYTIDYEVTDCNGNGPVKVSRDVVVFDSTAPMIYTTSKDGDTITMEVNHSVLDYMPEMLIVDNYYSLAELTMLPGGSYYTNFPTGVADKLGYYLATLSVTDGSMNTSMISFMIRVVDTEAPVITNPGTNFIEICRFKEVDPSELVVTVTDNFETGLTAVTSGTYFTEYLQHKKEGFYAIHFTATDGSGNVSEVLTKYVDVNCLTSIQENNFAGRVELYPNPTSNEFNLVVDLNSPDYLTINVINVLGEVVVRVENNEVLFNTYKVDMSALSSGVYYVSIKSKDAVLVKQVVLAK